MEFDEEVKKLIAADDPRCLDLIYNQLGERLCGYLSSMLGSRHDAQDVAQELFIQIARKRERLMAAANLDAYLFAMARNLARDFLNGRKVGRERMNSFMEYMELADDAEPFPEEEMARVDESLVQLPLEQKEAIVMKVFQSMTFEQIAQRLGVSINTAASRYRYGIQRLQKLLAG